jgi:dynein light intermediate chain 1, cytosolic
MLLVILLDWSEPWNWIRQLRAWIRLLHSLLQSLPPETVQVLEENIEEWRDRKRNDFKDTPATGADPASTLDAEVTLPLGPGEWDSPLGVPLCIVCQSSNLIDSLEKESGWKDRHFDFVQQFLRTILLKHGGSLIYTMPHLAGSESTLQRLVHASLGIQSMLQKQTLKHNTTNRDTILVPPNFDSWGKIRILTEDFNVQDVSEAWTRTISNSEAPTDDNQATASAGAAQLVSDDAVAMYEEVIKNPTSDVGTLSITGIPGRQQKTTTPGLEVDSKDTQAFLADQAAILEGLAREDERSALARESTKKAPAIPTATGDVEEHIGPVQFNMGGIQMDAEDMVKRLKVKSSPTPLRHKMCGNPKTNAICARIARLVVQQSQSGPRRRHSGRRMRRWRMRSY